jgi:hypothetical protein
VSTTTGPDGRYHFPDLRAGSAIVIAGDSWTHQQLCGAAVELRVGTQGTQLDVEVTSRANPQPPTRLPPLRVTGQVYEMTSSGRVGVEGTLIGTDWIAPDSPFLTIYSERDGRYTACGIPPNTSIAFETFKTGYLVTYFWRQFTADTTLDIELKR